MTDTPKTPEQGPWAENSAASTPSEASNGSAPAPALSDRFGHRTYVLKKQFFKMFGGKFRFYDANNNLVFFSKRKSFKLKEEIRLWTGEDMKEEVLSIKARAIIDLGSTYDVTDSSTGEKVGALRRKFFKSVIQDEWLILDAQDREMGKIKEDSTALALIRRFIDFAKLFLPQSFHGYIGSTPVCIFKQNANPFLAQITVDFSADTGNILDRRLGIAAAVLLCAIEGKQR